MEARNPTSRMPSAGVRHTRLPAPAWVLIAAMLALLALALGGCQKNQRRSTAEESLARAIAVVNNEKLLYEDFQNEYQLFLTKWDGFIQNDPAKKQEIKQLLLDRIIDDKLLDQEARRKGIEMDNAELNRRIAEVFAAAEEAPGGAAQAIQQRESLAEWSRQFRRRMVHRKLVQQEVVDKLRITPAEMRAYYDKHREQFRHPERVKVRHIAVGSRALYNRVMHLLASNRDFVELVQQYSITPDRFEDGALGYVERGVLPQEFDEAVFKMERIGSLTPRDDPVKTQMGYHIFRLEGRRPEGLLSFRDALPEIRRALLQERQGDAYRRWLENLRNKGTVVIDEQLLHAD